MWNAAFSERSNLRIVPWHPCARANAVLQVAHDLYTIVQALVEASYVDGAHVTTENHHLPKTNPNRACRGIESARGDMDRVEEEIFLCQPPTSRPQGFEGRQLLFDLHFCRRLCCELGSAQVSSQLSRVGSALRYRCRCSRSQLFRAHERGRSRSYKFGRIILGFCRFRLPIVFVSCHFLMVGMGFRDAAPHRTLRHLPRMLAVSSSSFSTLIAGVSS